MIKHALKRTLTTLSDKAGCRGGCPQGLGWWGEEALIHMAPACAAGRQSWEVILESLGYNPLHANPCALL